MQSSWGFFGEWEEEELEETWGQIKYTNDLKRQCDQQVWALLLDSMDPNFSSATSKLCDHGPITELLCPQVFIDNQLESCHEISMT